MTKRPLAVQNQICNDENRIMTRSNKKRVADFNENDENLEKKRKKSRSDIENIDPKENVQIPVAEEKSNLNESVEAPIDREKEDEKGEPHPTNKDYLIFAPGGIVVSKTAFFWSDRYVKMIPHVDPDYYGMYVHNDFSCYGELEIVENCLLDLAKTVFVDQGIFARMKMDEKPKEKVNYVLGFRRLEALTYLLNHTDSIGGIDDGERFCQVMRLIGACYVTILRGLLPKEMFDKKKTENFELVKKLKKIDKKIPNFKQVLEQAMIIGRNYLTIGDTCSAYTAVINRIYQNWLFHMEKVIINFEGKSPVGLETLWEAMKWSESVEKNGIDSGEKETFDFMKEIKIYDDIYEMGGYSHDLRKWSKNERQRYSLESPGHFNEFWF